MNERTLIITRQIGKTKQYLKHIQHSHVWTTIREDAMEYTKNEVAQALAEKNGGTVEVL